MTIDRKNCFKRTKEEVIRKCICRYIDDFNAYNIMLHFKSITFRAIHELHNNFKKSTI